MGQREFSQQNVDAQFSIWGDAAIYTAPDSGAQPVSCQIILNGGASIEAIEGSRFVADSKLVKVRASEVVNPKRGGRFQYVDTHGAPIGDVMVINAQPRSEDALRLVWTCEVPK